MSDWDASDDEGTTTAAPVASTSNVVSKKAAWADEEDLPDNEVKDSWEDSDEEEKPKPSTNGAAPIIRNKGSTKAKIAAKEAAEAQRLKDIEERDSEDPMERKRREMEMQMNADLENARSLFGGASLADGTDAENADIFSLVANPKTKDDFEAISTALAKRVVDKYSTKPLYAHFVEHLTRELCMPLKDLDVKKVSSTLAALGNEKQKQAKEGTGKKGGKGKAKPSLGAVAAGTKGGVTGRGYSADLDSHADALDNEYDDFM